MLLVLVAVPAFVSLGFWQWHRGEYRSRLWDSFARADVPAIQANGDSLDSLPRFTRVQVTGEFDAGRQVLLDNISRAGAPGYEVLTLLRLADGSHLIVDRGWLPFGGYRDRLPDVRLAAPGAQQLSGRLSTLPVAGIASGKAPPPDEGPWPRLTSFPSHEDLAHLWKARLRQPVLLLDAGSGPGYLRDWKPPGVPPDRNFSYAIQWWSFALLAVSMFIGLNLKRRT